MRDCPSALLAMECAMTGHQTYTTLHANSSCHIPIRLLEIGVPPYLVYDYTTVTGLISQRLLPILCPKCRVPILDALNRFDSVDTLRLRRAFKDIENIYVTNPAGCDAEGCVHGECGRTAVAEVIETTPEFMHVLKTGDQDMALAYFVEKGGLTMKEHARRKVEAGIVDPFMAEKDVGYFDVNREPPLRVQKVG
jgi:type II secretory ATPase GspE/PulE/Tfp pilus assembly ATPase PilB-like protein